MAWAKSLLSTLESGVIDQATLDYTSERIASIRVSKEGQEGLNAFFDKRSPDWTIANSSTANGSVTQSPVDKNNTASAPGAK